MREYVNKMHALWHEIFRGSTIAEIQRYIGLVGEAHAAYHTYPIGELLAATPCPYQRLELFAQYWSHLPLQGSPEWLADKRAACEGGGRVPTFGGSDVDTFLGFNAYQNVKKLYANRLGLAPFSGNNATQWGNICEEITSLLCEHIFRSTTYETGSLPGHIYRGNVIQRYSPDRIGVVAHSIMAPYLERAQAFTWGKRDAVCAPEPIPRKSEYTVLFEYKNPFNRIPDGTVPKQYTGQMQLGMATIPFVDFAVFVDCMIRKCSRTQFLQPSEYCRDYHPDASVPPETTAEPIYSGFIGFYEQQPAGAAPNCECGSGVAGALAAIRALQAARAPVGVMAIRQMAGVAALSDADLEALIDAAPGLNGLFPDFGEWDYIGTLTKRACDEKFQMPGLRLYYSGFCGRGEDPEAWLQAALQRFQAACTRGGHRAFGIMPYKLYQVSIVPMPRCPEFMEKVVPILEDAYDALSRLVTAPDRDAALEALYPSRPRAPRPVAVPVAACAAPSADAASWDDIE